MRVLWICSIWPEPTSSAAGARTKELISACVENGSHVIAASPGQSNRFELELRALTGETVSIRPNDSSFDAFVKGFNPEVVCFDRFMMEEQFGWRVREQCPDAVRVLDTVDLHSVRLHRQTCNRSEWTESLGFPPGNDERFLRELAAILRSDVTLVVSKAEKAFLHSMCELPDDCVVYCPFSYPVMETVPSFEERRNFVTIGNFLHPPNVDAVQELAERIWPALRGLFVADGMVPPELHLYGAYPPPPVVALTDEKRGFCVKGWCEDACATLSQYRVNLAPLRFGAGLKGKILAGWAAGTPCVTSPVGMEGIEDESMKGMVAHDVSEFTQKAFTLFTTEGVWRDYAKRGTEMVRCEFNNERVKSTFLCSFLRRRSSLSEISRGRILHSLVWHQTLRSTEYFSRWIELKNQR